MHFDIWPDWATNIFFSGGVGLKIWPSGSHERIYNKQGWCEQTIFIAINTIQEYLFVQNWMLIQTHDLLGMYPMWWQKTEFMHAAVFDKMSMRTILDTH